MTDRWTERLSEYIDGQLDEHERAALDAHLGGCAACRRTLDELRTIVQFAGVLPSTPPDADLWPGILTRIRDDVRVIPIGSVGEAGSASGAGSVRNEVGHVAEPPSRPRYATARFTLSLSQLAAAAAIVAFLSGSTVWLALRAGAGDDPMFVTQQPPSITSTEAVDAQFTASATYDSAIRQLEQELELVRDRLDPETVALIEHNLEVIDAAIQEARQALARDPANAFLYRHLDATMMKKIDMLRRVTTIGRGQA